MRERDKCYTRRLFPGVLPDFTRPVQSFGLENQELGSYLATDRDVDATVGEIMVKLSSNVPVFRRSSPAMSAQGHNRLGHSLVTGIVVH